MEAGKLGGEICPSPHEFYSYEVIKIRMCVSMHTRVYLRSKEWDFVKSLGDCKIREHTVHTRLPPNHTQI